MNKELRKTIESELSKVITTYLSVRDEIAAAQITKHIRESVKSIAKKFVKNIPQPTNGKQPKSALKTSKVGTAAKKTGDSSSKGKPPVKVKLAAKSKPVANKQ